MTACVGMMTCSLVKIVTSACLFSLSGMIFLIVACVIMSRSTVRPDAE